MREALINNSFAILLLCFIIELLLFVYLLYKAIKHKKTPYSLCGIICAGLFFDVGIIFLGNYMMGSLDILKSLSLLRFILHGALTPLCLMVCAYVLKVNKKSLKTWWCITVIIMIVGSVSALFTDLILDDSAGIIRYSSSANTPIWSTVTVLALSFATVIPIIISGIIVIVKRKEVYLFLSGLFMFLFSMIAPATGNNDLNFLITAFGEILLILFMYLAINKIYKK